MFCIIQKDSGFQAVFLFFFFLLLSFSSFLVDMVTASRGRGNRTRHMHSGRLKNPLMPPGKLKTHCLETIRLLYLLVFLFLSFLFPKRYLHENTVFFPEAFHPPLLFPSTNPLFPAWDIRATSAVTHCYGRRDPGFGLGNNLWQEQVLTKNR